MTVGYGGRITRKGHWLDVIFISNEDSKENKKKEDDDEDKCLSVEGRFFRLTNNMSERGQEYNRRIKSNTKIYRFPYEHASYMHSASISEDYLILIEIPFHFNTFNATRNSIADGTVTDMFKWNGATMPTYFRILSVDTDEQVARIPGPAFFTFHHINSYQSKDNPKKIIVDICFDDARIINELYLNKLRENIFSSGTGYTR